MLTLKEIALRLDTTVQRARMAAQRAGVTPIDKSGRTHLYEECSLTSILDALDEIPTRIRRAKPTASTQTESAVAATEQGSQTAIPPIDAVASDPQAVSEPPSNL